jgi:hypothetical protein
MLSRSTNRAASRANKMDNGAKRLVFNQFPLVMQPFYGGHPLNALKISSSVPNR